MMRELEEGTLNENMAGFLIFNQADPKVTEQLLELYPHLSGIKNHKGKFGMSMFLHDFHLQFYLQNFTI